MSGEKESTPEAKDGLTGNPDTDPAAKLLMDAPLEGRERLLLIEGGCGRLAAHFAPRFKQVINQNMLYRNHRIAQEMLTEKMISNVVCQLSDIPNSSPVGDVPPVPFDEIIFRLGRGTALINAALIEAFNLLRVGGSLWVSGHNQEGIKSFAKRAEAHFGNAHLLRIKSSCRLLKFQKIADQPATPLEGAGYFTYGDLEIEIPKLGTLVYSSKPGVFSYRATDIGTALLAKYLPDCTGLTVLDLGCGSGVLSLAACKLGANSVLAADVNVVATTCATYNFDRYQVPAASLCTNLTEGIEGEFDMVFSNPPFHHGSETDFSFPGKILDAILPKLKTGGTVFLVANRFLNYMTQAASRFQSTEVLSREHGYCVYRFVK